MNNRAEGITGEDTAAKYLTDNGCEVLTRNFTCPSGEIDIIARDNGVLVFIEVKSRGGGAYGLPAEAVTRTKQNKISRAAATYIMRHRLVGQPARFDVIEVLRGNIRHIRNAFNSTVYL